MFDWLREVFQCCSKIVLLMLLVRGLQLSFQLVLLLRCLLPLQQSLLLLLRRLHVCWLEVLLQVMLLLLLLQ